MAASSAYSSCDAFYAIDGNPLTDWASQQQGTATKLSIDLGAVYNLTAGSFTDRVTSGAGTGTFAGGLTDFTTAFSLQSCTTFACDTLVGPLLTFTKSVPTLPSGPAAFAYAADLTGLSGQYFLYSVTAVNRGGPNPGLSELTFTGAPVPEPATWAMMIGGFALAGAAMRRRKLALRLA